MHNSKCSSCALCLSLADIQLFHWIPTAVWDVPPPRAKNAHERDRNIRSRRYCLFSFSACLVNSDLRSALVNAETVENERVWPVWGWVTKPSCSSQRLRRRRRVSGWGLLGFHSTSSSMKVTVTSSLSLLPSFHLRLLSQCGLFQDITSCSWGRGHGKGLVITAGTLTAPYFVIPLHAHILFYPRVSQIVLHNGATIVGNVFLYGILKKNKKNPTLFERPLPETPSAYGQKENQMRRGSPLTQAGQYCCPVSEWFVQTDWTESLNEKMHSFHSSAEWIWICEYVASGQTPND